MFLFMFLLLLKVNMGDGIVIRLKPLVVSSEGQNFLITFIALAAEGVCFCNIYRMQMALVV